MMSVECFSLDMQVGGASGAAQLFPVGAARPRFHEMDCIPGSACGCHDGPGRTSYSAMRPDDFRNFGRSDARHCNMQVPDLVRQLLIAHRTMDTSSKGQRSVVS